jgi:4-aminobutyrate aminotransferase-like enzyme
MPPASGLDTALVVNSGSEANDLAWRIATTLSGHRGAVVTSVAYHGVSAAIADASPEEWPSGYDPPHVARIDPLGEIDEELERAASRTAEVGLAATFVDGGFTSDGILEVPPAALAAIVARTHAAGGFYVADEVQIGHGRTGEALWSFVRDGITPDFVTLGKSMGNGYPVAAVITRREIAERFAGVTHFFSTFGGNPVAARAALTVLEVIDDERLVEHAGEIGAYLSAALRDLAESHAEIVAVRGHGLLVGVELASAHRAERIVDELRERRILIGRTGREENVLKIRPPLPFAEDHADLLVETLGSILTRG